MPTHPRDIAWRGTMVSEPTLDDRFAPPIPAQTFSEPGGSKEWERRYSPLSLTVLNHDTAAALRTMMDDITAGWRIGRVLTADVIFIWAVDEAGTLLIAVEKILIDGKPAEIPRQATIEEVHSLPKLGHPAIVDGRLARIAGELFFDTESGSWILNNKSARYSRHPTRQPQHLANVAAIFRRFEIAVETRFLHL